MTDTKDAGSADNGVNVGALLAAREAVSETPEAAQFKWRATCAWQNGTHSRSSVEGYFGLGDEQRHKREFVFDATTRRRSRRKTTAPRPPNTCSSASPVA